MIVTVRRFTCIVPRALPRIHIQIESSCQSFALKSGTSQPFSLPFASVIGSFQNFLAEQRNLDNFAAPNLFEQCSVTQMHKLSVYKLPYFHKHCRLEKLIISEVMSVESPEKAIIQLPEKLWGIDSV